MKIFVALDEIILLTVCCIFYSIDEKKVKYKIKEKEFEKRHNERVEKAFRENRVLSEKITRMYARELYKCGDAEDFLRAAD